MLRTLPTRAIATVLTLAYVVASDARSLSPAALLTLAGWLALASVVLNLLEFAFTRVAVPQRVLPVIKRLAPATLALGPLTLGLVRWWLAGNALPSWTPAALVLTALAAAIAFSLAGTPTLYPASKWGFASLWSAATLTAAFIAMNVATGTMVNVQPRTGELHVGLFLASWLVSTALVLPLATRFVIPSAEAVLSRYQRAAAGAVVVFGVALLEVDRRVLVDLYPDVHLWLGVLGLLTLDAGLRGLASLVPSRALRPASALAFALTIGALGYATATVGRLQDIQLRSSLQRSPLGQSMLSLLPAPPRKKVVPIGEPIRFEQELSFNPLPKRLNLLLVSVDTLRGDIFTKNTADVPNLLAFAESSSRFERAYSGGPRTALGMGTLMCGRYSAYIDWELWPWVGGRFINPHSAEGKRPAQSYTTIANVPPNNTLAERLSAAGYRTMATAYADGDFFRPGVGFERGFQQFDDLTEKDWSFPTSQRVLEQALLHLTPAQEEPWFQWIHFYDPHENKRSRERYGEGLRELDRAFGDLLTQLEQRQLLDRTVVALVADHGEAFSEHRHSGHGTSLFDEQVRVPLIIKLPGVAAKSYTQPVAAIDLTATLVALARAPSNELDGLNLLPLILEQRYPKDRPVFTEGHRFKGPTQGQDLKAVILGDYKLIVDRRRNTAALFNLTKDPEELVDLSDRQPEMAARLLSLLERFTSHGEADHPLPNSELQTTADSGALEEQ